jgi:hypothetical protein
MRRDELARVTRFERSSANLLRILVELLRGVNNRERVSMAEES